MSPAVRVITIITEPMQTLRTLCLKDIRIDYELIMHGMFTEKYEIKNSTNMTSIQHCAIVANQNNSEIQC